MSKLGWFWQLGVTQGHQKWHHLIERTRVPVSVPYYYGTLTGTCPYLAPFLRYKKCTPTYVQNMTKCQRIQNYYICFIQHSAMVQWLPVLANTEPTALRCKARYW